MRDVAMRLTQDQITSVAAWLALQSAPIQAAPAPPGRWKTPVPCGSQPQ